jgi:CRP-like cAMP-binding protein
MLGPKVGCSRFRYQPVAFLCLAAHTNVSVRQRQKALWPTGVCATVSLSFREAMLNFERDVEIEPLASKFERLGMNKDELDVLVQFLKHRARVPAGADIVDPAQSIGQSPVLLSGMACSYRRLENGAREIYSFQHPGDFCDLYRYVLPERNDAIAVQALTDCLVATIAHADIERLLAQRPRLGLLLWRATALEAGIVRERLSNARRGSAVQRVANLLCEQIARREAIGITSPLVPITQIDVADAAGLSVVHVNRTIQALRRLDVLSKASHAIEVTDRERLARIAEFDGRYLNMPQLLSKWAVRIEESVRPQNMISKEVGSVPRGASIRLHSLPNRTEPPFALGRPSLIGGSPPDRRHGKAPR